ncbi:uncharacterized protein LOC131431254 isoform X2 [Malaya genurostris]|uniref:uncharacterized protein LOC131431254 isoform X2 n=1 Tax=Malaya genurostris TaxID=325434 RepID=UPI0026F38A43|nr:uncharacterized protein LOC131431254 isoform X2 [Malaya genurostris]
MSHSKASYGSCCFICKSPEDNELLYGKIFSKWRLRVHYYCLLLSSNLVQNGESDEVGIFGFLQPDIKSEEARIQNQKCYICKGRYANIHCCAKKCFRTFHTVCGIQSGCLSHFVDTFQSWCDKHVELQSDVLHGEEDVCGICYDAMGPYNKLESIYAPCCQNGWFHRRCVAQFAQTAGYFFKCPLCNNKDDFGRAMQLRGVFIPEKDAAWELEPNAFGEQLERPSECDAEECLCRYGRDYDNNAKWDLRLCETCGSTCRHDLCMEVPTKNYVCTFCRPIVGDEVPAAVMALVEASRRAEAARRAAASATSSDEDDEQNSNRRESGIHSPGSSSSSMGNSSRSSVVRASGKRRHVRLESSDSMEMVSSKSQKGRQRRVVSTDSSMDSPIVLCKNLKWKKQNCLTSEESDSGSEIGFKSKQSKSHRRFSSSSSSQTSLSSFESEDIRLRQIVMKLSLEQGVSIDKLLIMKPVVRLRKLSEDEIKTMTSSESEEMKFDFNYRVKLNKNQRRRTMTDLQTIKDIIRSDTDTLTDSSVGQETTEAKTPSHKSFAKRFQLKLFGSKSTGRKRINHSSSESDQEQPAKKLCHPHVPQSKSKSRISLFPTAENSENTCPNSPQKVSVEPNDSESKPPAMVAKLRSPPVISPSTDSTSAVSIISHKAPVIQHQKTLISFFKKTSPSTTTTTGSTLDHNDSTVSGSGGSSAITPVGSSGKSAKKTPASAQRKKLVELDRSQKNLLDYFNRC